MNKFFDFLIITLIFSLLVVLPFYIWNDHEVVFKYVYEWATSLRILVIGFSTFSFLLGFIFAIRNWSKDRREKKELKSKIYDYEKQIDGMKLSLETLSNNMISKPTETKSLNSAIGEETNIISKKNNSFDETKTDDKLVNDILSELKSNQ